MMREERETEDEGREEVVDGRKEAEASWQRQAEKSQDLVWEQKVKCNRREEYEFLLLLSVHTFVCFISLSRQTVSNDHLGRHRSHTLTVSVYQLHPGLPSSPLFEREREPRICCSLHLPWGLSPSSSLLEFVRFISSHFLLSLLWLDNCKVATFEKFPLRNIYSWKERVKTYWLETLFSVSFPALMSLVFVLWVVSFLFSRSVPFVSFPVVCMTLSTLISHKRVF